MCFDTVEERGERSDVFNEVANDQVGKVCRFNVAASDVIEIVDHEVTFVGEGFKINRMRGCRTDQNAVIGLVKGVGCVSKALRTALG